MLLAGLSMRFLKATSGVRAAGTVTFWSVVRQQGDAPEISVLNLLVPTRLGSQPVVTLFHPGRGPSFCRAAPSSVSDGRYIP